MSVFRSDDDRYMAGALKCVLEGLTTHGNPAGHAAHDAVMAGLDPVTRAAADYAIAAVRYDAATRDATQGED